MLEASCVIGFYGVIGCRYGYMDVLDSGGIV